MILMASRDKTLITVEISHVDETCSLVSQAMLHGHSHFISDVVMSNEGLTRSLAKGQDFRSLGFDSGVTTLVDFEDHTKDVLSVAFSADNRQIMSQTVVTKH